MYNKKNINAILLKPKILLQRGLKAIVNNARKICGNKPLGINILYAINEYDRVIKDACEAGVDVIITGAGLPTNMPEFTADYPHIALSLI